MNVSKVTLCFIETLYISLINLSRSENGSSKFPNISLHLNVYSHFQTKRMKKLFEAFEKPNLSDWKSQLIKELKSNNPSDPTAFEDEIEALVINEIYEESTLLPSIEIQKTNDWQIGVNILVTNEKEANKSALELLNLGATSLNFDVQNLDVINLSELLAGIELAYIHSYFTVKHEAQETAIHTWLADKNPFISHVNTDRNIVNAFEVNAIGGNSTQELAFALAKGKYILESENATCIHFTFGIGANFMLEIAKFRAFHLLWDKLTTVYQSSIKTTITAKTGFVNKSLNDPYTNILRQTTESLAAVLGGVDQLIIEPYDTLSSTGSSSFTERMAINISLILKEESEINQLVDPLNGSLSIEKLTQTLADSTWKLFQQLEKLGGSEALEVEEYLKNEIERIRNSRIAQINDKRQLLVGVNQYFNPEQTNITWKKDVGTFLGMEYLILEKELIKEGQSKIKN